MICMSLLDAELVVDAGNVDDDGDDDDDGDVLGLLQACAVGGGTGGGIFGLGADLAVSGLLLLLLLPLLLLLLFELVIGLILF